MFTKLIVIIKIIFWSKLSSKSHRYENRIHRERTLRSEQNQILIKGISISENDRITIWSYGFFSSLQKCPCLIFLQSYLSLSSILFLSFFVSDYDWSDKDSLTYALLAYCKTRNLEKQIQNLRICHFSLSDIRKYRIEIIRTWWKFMASWHRNFFSLRYRSWFLLDIRIRFIMKRNRSYLDK